MQRAILKLHEIIWEITGACKNGCNYCGSKECWNEEIHEDRIKEIVDRIAKYPPKEIDISGGDPLLVSYETHKYVVDTLKDQGVKCKILFNLKSFDAHNTPNLLNLYDHVGLSINNQKDLDLFQKAIKSVPALPIVLFKKLTVITNFNLENIFLFNTFKDLVKTYDLAWMIQYTVYKNESDSLAIYNNDGALKYLQDQITTALSEKVKIILSDNLTEGPCGAGLNGLGILSDGTVVPCLSMRSWENMSDVSQGNILFNSLEGIWYESFQKYRFCEFKCCKDHCKNKTIFAKVFNPNILFPEHLTLPLPRDIFINPSPHIPYTAYYAVVPWDNGQVYAYAVKGWGPGDGSAGWGSGGPGSAGGAGQITTTASDTWSILDMKTGEVTEKSPSTEEVLEQLGKQFSKTPKPTPTPSKGTPVRTDK